MNSVIGGLMGSLLKITILSLFFWSQIAAFAQTAADARFLSLTIRDKGMSVSEAKDLANGNANLDELITTWIESSEHDDRIRRYFNDMFGVTNDLFIMDTVYYLKKNAQGAWYSEGKGDCEDAGIASGAWWLEPPQTENFCANILSSDINFDGGTVGCAWGSNIFASDGRCGCGENQILCLPEAYRVQQHNDVRFEFQERALHGYKNGQTWKEILGGAENEQFFGSRLLYHFYIHTSYVFGSSQLPPEQDILRLISLPLTSKSQASWPTGIERSGLVTSPSFMKQYNNFRSRIRAITERLLCQDVDGGLNTDGINVFLNPDLGDQSSHGSKEGCASCHYPMDNMGSTILGWSDQGIYNTWANPSQLGHSFGQQGSGPKFLMASFVDRGPGFFQCMAKRAWEDFSRESWDDLSEDNQLQFIAFANQGPQALIHNILIHPSLRSISQRPILEESSLSFEVNIKPVLENSCAGSSCHSSDSVLGPQYRFNNDEGLFRSIPMNRLSDGTMPPPGSGKTITEGDIQFLKDFLK